MACNPETFTWSIRNFSLCPLQEGDCLASPTFSAESLQETKWCLKLYPKGYSATENSLSCFLRRVDSLREPEVIVLGFSLSVKKDTQAYELGSSKNVSFACHRGMGFDKSIPLRHLFNKKELFLPNDTLTLQCCLWPTNRDVGSNLPNGTIPDTISMDSYVLNIEENSTIVSNESSVCTKNYSSESCFVTTIPVDRHCVTWKIRGFQISEEFKRVAIISSKIREKSELVWTCYTHEDSSSQTWLRVDIQRKDHDMRQMMLKAKISVLNKLKNVHSSKEDYHLFGDDHRAWKFLPLINLSQIEVNNLLDKNELYLQCDFHASFKDEHVTLFKNRLQSVNSTLFSDYNSDMGRMLHDFRSPVCKEHKNILCSHSPLFKAMSVNFANKKISSVDQDRDALIKVVAYLFNTEFIGEYEYEDVKTLYSVAAEYHIDALKRKCVSYLKSQITQSNVWDILTFAYLHNDEDLKESLHFFLLLNRETVFKSQEWEDLMNNSSQLSGDIMKKVLTLKVNY